MKMYIFCTISFILSIFSIASACKGCVNLDEHNFHKIVPRFEVVLVKFDIAYPYGEKQDLFANVASQIVDNENIILGQIGVRDYGEKENEEFSKKYGILSKDDLPALRLFVQGEDEPFSFDKNQPWTEENVKRFVRDHTNIYLGLPGCLEIFDKIAIKFTNSNGKEAILKEAEEELKGLEIERQKEIGNIYIKFMKKIIDNGTSFVHNEENRLAKILKEGKMNDKKKDELSNRLNILKSFAIQSGKTEL